MWDVSGPARIPAALTQAPLIAECLVDLECRLVHAVPLPSPALCIGEVIAPYTVENILDARGEVDWARAQPVADPACVVRERPVPNNNMARLREQVRARDGLEGLT